jgi:DNA-binding LacI/PurR family transcriptional regulator
VGTVHAALGDLEARGYLLKKHGAGTFIASRYRPVTLKDTVAVSMSSGEHVWSELWALIMNGLNERHLFPLGIEMGNQNRDQLLARFSHTEADYYLVHGSYDVPFQLFQKPGFQNKPVIGVVGWETDGEWPGLYRVLTDYDMGGTMVARHLRGRGHRRVLIVRPPTDRWVVDKGWALNGTPLRFFMREWEACGGSWVHLPSESSSQPDTPLDEEKFLTILSQSNRPTAIFGTRDFEVWQAQQIIRCRLPALDGQIELVGYYDTPWSRAGAPPFTTVSLDLPTLAEGAMAMLDALRAGVEPEKRLVMIRPKLVVRGH